MVRGSLGLLVLVGCGPSLGIGDVPVHDILFEGVDPIADPPAPGNGGSAERCPPPEPFEGIAEKCDRQMFGELLWLSLPDMGGDGFMELESRRDDEGGGEAAGAIWVRNTHCRARLWACGDELVPLTRVDSCGLVDVFEVHGGAWQNGGIGSSSRGSVVFDATSADAHAGNEIIPLPLREDGGARWTVPRHTAAFGEPYGFTVLEAEGNDLVFPEAIVFPASLEITSELPEPSGVLGRGPVDLSWTGTSAVPLVLKLTARTEPEALGGDARIREIRCVVEDDGAFTIPGELVTELPASNEVSLTMRRSAGRVLRPVDNVVEEFKVAARVDLALDFRLE